MNLFKLSKNPTVSLHGGLGNQLFQYAFGRAISEKFKSSIEFDIYGFNFDLFYKRKLELDYFQIKNYKYVHKSFLFKSARLIAFLHNKIPITSFLLKSIIITDKNVDTYLDSYKPNISGDRYFYGYWQDEKYFYSLRNDLRKEILIKDELSTKNKILAKEIASKNSIALHCRRLHGVGATSNIIENSDKSQTLNLDYYLQAISYIQERVEDPYFFVFSDSPDWAREHLSFIQNVSFLELNRGFDYEDIVLMSLCNHNIIANSSFSWWGAWLGESKDKVIIAPSMIRYMPNVPDRWVKI